MGPAGRGLVSPMIEALLKSLYAGSHRFTPSKTVLLPIALALTEAYRNYPISLVGKVRPEGFVFEAACPREGEALCEAMLNNRACEAARRPGIREALLRNMVVINPDKAEQFARKFLSTSTALEKISLFQVLAALDERKKRYDEAIDALEQAIQEQEILRKDYTEAHKHKSINELICLYIAEMKIMAAKHDLNAVRKLCLKSIALLPNMQQMNEVINPAALEITGRMEQEIRLGETWDNQYNYVQEINLCADYRLDDLAESLLKKYMEYLRAFPVSPYKRMKDPPSDRQWLAELQKLERACQRELAKNKKPSLHQAWQECHEMLLAALQKNQ
jgi:hypothetical protein